MTIFADPLNNKRAENFEFWTCPKGMTQEQARNWFLQHKKPRIYQLHRFTYYPEKGLIRTLECQG